MTSVIFDGTVPRDDKERVESLMKLFAEFDQAGANAFATTIVDAMHGVHSADKFSLWIELLDELIEAMNAACERHGESHRLFWNSDDPGTLLFGDENCWLELRLELRIPFTFGLSTKEEAL